MLIHANLKNYVSTCHKNIFFRDRVDIVFIHDETDVIYVIFIIIISRTKRCALMFYIFLFFRTLVKE